VDAEREGGLGDPEMCSPRKHVARKSRRILGRFSSGQVGGLGPGLHVSTSQRSSSEPFLGLLGPCLTIMIQVAMRPLSVYSILFLGDITPRWAAVRYLNGGPFAPKMQPKGTGEVSSAHGQACRKRAGACEEP